MATAVRSDDDLLDYATVFDDEDFLDLFLASASSHSKSGTQQPSFVVPGASSLLLAPSHHLTNHHVEDAPAPALSASYHHEPSDPTAPLQVGSLSTVSTSDSPPSSISTVCAVPVAASSSSSGVGGMTMSIVMLVDPVTDQVTLPQQQVIAGTSNEIVTIGPTVLSNFSKLDFTSLDLGGLLGTTNFLSAAKGIDSHPAPSAAAAAPPAPTESKFLPITPFSLQSDASSSSLWNPQPLVAPSSSAAASASHHQPFALGTGLLPFQSLSLHHPEPPQTPSLTTSESSYNCVSEASSLDGRSLTSSTTGSSTTSTNAPVVPAPTTVAAPLRALSAYNFFFRDERDRILHGGEIEWTKDKQEQLLQNHWNQDRSKKRRHRKSHGKIDFSTLSKVISTRWKELPEVQKDFFREVAARDWERFQRELAEYKHGASIDAAAAAAAAAASSNNGAAAAGNSFASFSFSTVIG